MNNQQPKDITYQKIAWTIRNYSTLKTNTRHCSEVFTIGDCNWKVAVYRGKQDGKFLATYLNVADPSSLPPGWSIYADFTFTVVNQSSRERSAKGDMKCTFSAENAGCRGDPTFMYLNQLEKRSSGFISNDECIVEVEFYVVKRAGFAPGNGSGDGMVDFKGLGRIEKPFVPLLEEVFSWYPSLLDCKKNRTRWFTEWAFNVLGRVLQFLKEKKWKDLKDEKTCEELQCLWQELGKSGLDLSWLEPNVKSALKMKGYETKAEKVKKLEQKLKALETQMKDLKKKVCDTEQTVKMTRKELENAEGFEEKDLDAIIGYRKP